MEMCFLIVFITKHTFYKDMQYCYYTDLPEIISKSSAV